MEGYFHLKTGNSAETQKNSPESVSDLLSPLFLIIVISLIEIRDFKDKSSKCVIPGGYDINNFHLMNRWDAIEYLSSKYGKAVFDFFVTI